MSVASTEAQATSCAPRPAPTRPSARIRAATVRRRLLQVTDALAAAHLLLGMNASVRAVEDQAREAAP